MIVTIMLSVPIPMDPLFVIVKTDIVDMVNGVKVSYTTVIVISFPVSKPIQTQ
jgi:hypothetical protein